MDSSAPKRRKTSPTSSVPVPVPVPVESTTPPDPPPPQQEQQLQSSPSRSPQRPSFASPTKSSLARHNPEILSRRRETASQRPADLPASRPASRDEDTETSAALIAQLEHPSEGDRTVSSTAGLQDATAAQTGRAPAATREGRGQDAPPSPVRRAGGSTLGAQPPRRTPNRPEPRPLPPPGPENEEDLLSPFIGRTLRRSPVNTGVLPTVVQEEPELPPTPQHPDPVVSTPPSGIHNTPSKRRRAREDEDEKEKEGVRQNSPSKGSGEQAPPRKEAKKAKMLRVARRGSPVSIIEKEAPITQQREEKKRPASEFAPGTHPRRSIRLRGVNWEKQQERGALLREIARLEADLELATEEGKFAAKGRSSSVDKSGVLDLLRRHLLTPEKEPEPDPNAEWLEAAMNPIALLGFNGSASSVLPAPLVRGRKKEAPKSRPISHHPVQMTAAEELPYLQVFTPLTFTSTITTIPSPEGHPDQPNPQKHTIHVASATPPGLFTARLEMVVNTRTLGVTSLTVPRLDPAAAAELKPLIASVTSRQAPYHSALTRNVSIVTWAMGEWYRVALKRAKFWHALEKQLGVGENKENGLVEVVGAMRTRKKKRRRRGQHQEWQEEEDEGGDGGGSFRSADSATAGLDSMLLSKSDLLPHMGRTRMDLEIPYLAGEDGAQSELRIKWGIEFDWTGEARSRIGVEVGAPGKWQAVDDRKSIVGIPKLFDKLVQGCEDPSRAVKTVVALLAGEPAT